ncbi:hypothetical protein [Lacrimispora sp.]|uniref:hypothetical protein n=1 Tax=Lacrimispora sp. TaxID=2719234 RepID=UPI0028AE4FAB|nr:hypothetical protein [Lacrimispora sp.]
MEEALQQEPTEAGEDRIKETLPLEPMEEETESVKETLPLEPMEEETERVKETLPLEPMEEESERIKETLPLEPVEGGKGGADRINKTLLLETLEEDGYVIYWNPGGQLPVELATPSDAAATSSDAASTKARAGRDTASGLSPARPVKTLAKAIERAEKLMEKEGLDSSDVTIYAMNPMEVADGELYALNAGNIRIASWPGRPYESDALFYVNGGQLTLMNVLLEAEEPAYEPNETELVYVRGGVLQMGQGVNINGCVIMDYSSKLEDMEWKNDIATPANAVEAVSEAEADDTGSEGNKGNEKVLEKVLEKLQPLKSLSSAAQKAKTAGEASFNIDNYAIDANEEKIELVKDKMSVSTWRAPVIQFIVGFDGSSSEYLLDIKDDGRAGSREMVTTLYADGASAEDFLSYFTLAESDNWSLQVEIKEDAQLRDTESEDEIQPLSSPLEEELLTHKTLIASRSLDGATAFYWNPGGDMTISGITYRAGNDGGSYDGLTPLYPFKTWSRAAEEAKKAGGGVVVAMRSLNLGDADAGDYLGLLGGNFYLASEDPSLITTLCTWNVNPQPAIIVPKNKALVLENLSLGGGYSEGGNEADAPAVLVNEGDLIVEKNVGTEENGYIQVNAFPDLANHPVKVNSVDAVHDGNLRVFFGGINTNIGYRFIDVVIPGGALSESISAIADETDRGIQADIAGQALLGRIKLHDSNKSVSNGGVSNVDWILRQDTDEDDSVARPQNVELYAEYYYDSIYIDGVNGSDNNYGSSCEYPVKTWRRAKEIWEKEMLKSLAARQEAVGDGTALDKIETDYPMPEKIYICDTVTVDSASEPEWKLEPRYDYARGTDVKTEVVSHIDKIASQGEGNTVPRHAAPKTLIKVTGSGVLSIRDVFIRNMVDDTDSVTIKVEAGGTLNLRGETTLNGTRLKSTGFVQKDLTLGNHVTVTGGGHFVMESGWTGSIENREQGVVAAGSGTTVEMNDGFIQKNNSYRIDYYDAGITTHKAGGGVALSDGAGFTMNGGTITGNQTYQYGAGVYLGTGTSFIMKKGEISGNNIPVYYVSGKSSTFLHTQGAGIFAGTGTIVEIGDGSGVQEDTKISDNQAYLAYGAGIYADGKLDINRAAIIDNKCDIISQSSRSNDSISLGAGIYVGAHGTLTMTEGLVKGNGIPTEGVHQLNGAGIYIAGGTGTILKSTITENNTRFQVYTTSTLDCGRGGGIYLAGGSTLTITDTTISKNEAGVAGGIYAVGSSGNNVYLILDKTIIDGNKAIGDIYSSTTLSGDVGGVYFEGYGDLTLKDGTRIINNSAIRNVGGLYLRGNSSSHVYMRATVQGAIEISGNKAMSGYAGGVYHYGSYWSAGNVLIKDNTATTYGGGIYSSNAGSALFRDMDISGNKALLGGGLALNTGNYYIQDSSIENNTASDRGGGIYLIANPSLYLSETHPGKFKITGNHAGYGGGIAVGAVSQFAMNIAGPIQNSADKQGSNFYLNGSGQLGFLNGKFKQPELSEQVEGVYSIYINDTSTATNNKYFDFSKVTAEKKTEANHPDVIFLDSGNSFLTVIGTPPTGAVYGDFPIDLNTKVFKSGSVVLKAAGSVSIAVPYPDTNLSNIVTNNIMYSNIEDASDKLDYYRGGKLPRRNELGKFKDSNDSSRTNVILFGQGVYLDGTGGSDLNGGTSPADAVATFDKAKATLEANVTNTANDEAGLPEDEKEGFAPFIYICGQVNINTNDTWVLDYKVPLYKEVNKYYGIAEERNGDPVMEAQVRRFASFVKQPMIKVGNDSNSVAFTTGRLIIDGMADAVVLVDQELLSPVIYGSISTKVTLTGDSMITNNYSSALDIYGELTLNSENGTENKQIYNNQSTSAVRLYGSARMWMLGEAKIITDNTVERVANATSNGIVVMGTNVLISMQDDSAIIQGPGSSGLLKGSLITSDKQNTTIEMGGKARLEVGNITGSAVSITGNGSKIDMTDDASIATLENAYWTNGINMGANNSLEMSKRANITYGGAFATMAYGVHLSGSTAASVKMQDDAAINIADTATSGPNVFYAIYVSGVSPTVELLNNAKITGSRNIENYTNGIYVASSQNANILLNMEGGLEKGSASITDMTYGIYLSSSTNTSVLMGKEALISGKKGSSSNEIYGIYMTGLNSLSTETNIVMKDNSKICNTDYGIYVFTNNNGPINIMMEGHAAIEQNTRGISDQNGTGSNGGGGPWRLNIKMSDNTRISGNSSSGIQLTSSVPGWSEEGKYQKITLNDHAMIGGDNYYSSTDPVSGNLGAGIYASGPIEVIMNGNSKISGNGTNVSNGSGVSSGIFLTRATSTNYYRSGTAKVTLNDSASIRDNRGGGVYAATVSNSGVIYKNEVIIELNGIKDDGSFSVPSIEGNTDAVYLGIDATLKLKGEALVKISDSPYESGTYKARVINNYGYIELDGRSTVDGLIYMNDGTRPITMTHAVTNPARRYDLHLGEGFAGRAVVKPDGKPGGITDLTSSGSEGSQLAYFNKVSADGMAASKVIVEIAPNLVLQGENDVYLSGSGNDSNIGNSPSTPVRTFKRAKELLQGDGYYTTGANIIICGSTVTVLAGDEDWSFDPGGFVTNSLSGEKWQPLVARYKEYDGGLITLSSGTSTLYAFTVTFENITIDGGSEDGIILTSYQMDQLLTVYGGKTAILGEGAVLQNNKANSTGYNVNCALGVTVYGGTLEIDGGIIRNIVRETGYSSPISRFTSAVYVVGNGDYEAKLIMKSGQIINNELNAPRANSINSHIGTVYVALGGSMEMSGGLIENNKTLSTSTNPAGAGALVNYDGSITISGGIIRGNEGGSGSAIFYRGTSDSSQMIFSGGQIIGNKPISSIGKEPINAYSPIYVMEKGFELRGGGADIRDSIYLSKPLSAVKVSDHIYQTGRSYRIYLNPVNNIFIKGSVIVEPDGNKVTTVSSYLPFFDVRSNPYVLDQGRTGNLAGNVVGVKENQCLILMKAVYLDSVNGKDANTGLKPSQAVKSFTRANAVGKTGVGGTSDHYVIYVCGKATNTSSESVWTLPETAYMCRYTGFPVYESTGIETQELNRAYYGYLIEPDSPLTFRDISIQGRRSIDGTGSNGDSLVYISGGHRATVESGAVFSNNYNNGNYIAEDGYRDNLSSKGGAFQVGANGDLVIRGGEIKGNSAAYGNAVYLDASETDPLSIGILNLTGTPAISGNVYLDGTSNITAAYIHSLADYVPSSPLQVSVHNDYNGRPLIQYDDIIPGETELKHYSFDDAINALYDIVNRSSDPHMLELNQRKVIYLDGQEGDDGDDGTTPEKAFKTLKKTFEAIGEQADTKGVLVYVVGTLDIAAGTSEPSDIQLMNIKVSAGGTYHYEGYYEDLEGKVNIRGQVYFKRYSKPKDYDAGNPVYDGYGKETLRDSLFDVGDGGQLILSGIYLDGHSVSNDSIQPTLAAPGVEALSPLITVKNTGILKCSQAEGGDVPGGISTKTMFVNNINRNDKSKVLDQLNGSPIREGSGAGIELLDGGICYLEYTEFVNLALGDLVPSGGTAVYSNGFLSFRYMVNFGGSVFLEGFGTKEDAASHDTSRYLTVTSAGIPLMDKFQLMMRDPYMGRDVVHYPDSIEPIDADAAYFLLEERVKDFFRLANRSTAKNILELQVPTAVYVSGTTGIDAQEDRVAGSTPKHPVKTLKRAFELLKTRGGNTIYVVGTIQADRNIQVTGQSYIGTDGTVMLGSTDKVKIVRYIQPDFVLSDPTAGAAAEYDVPDFTGVLLNVKENTAAQFSTNVSFDGHSEPKKSVDLPVEVIVADGYNEAKAPLINVEKGGALNLLSNVSLYDNYNTYDPAADSDGQHGGAIYNSGTTTVDGTLFENNKAAKGAVVYQDGTFTILSAPENLKDHLNTFYLTSENTGTETSPVWGADHVIQTAAAIPEGLTFDIDMDPRRAVKGRDVVRFTNSSAYDPNADAEHDHFRLGSTVPENLFLVEAENDPEVLELQNWEVLKVEVPTDIYLVVSRRGSYDSTNKLVSVNASSAETELFTAPEYVIKNKGSYDAKVSISGFKNQTMEAGITSDPADLMNLTANVAVTTAENDLYLAVKGWDDAIGGTGFNNSTEISLQLYAESTVTEAPIVLGTLNPGTSGNFTFVGAVGTGFVDKYMDASFPIEGSAKSEVQEYMDGTSNSGVINAKAKYLLKYKVEIDPSRRIP